MLNDFVRSMLNDPSFQLPAGKKGAFCCLLGQDSKHSFFTLDLFLLESGDTFLSAFRYQTLSMNPPG